MVATLVAVGAHLGVPVVDPVVCLFLAMVAPPLLGLRLALALVVVDPLGLVYPLAHLGLVVGILLVVLVVLVVVVDPVDILAPLVANRHQARPAVAAHQAIVITTTQTRYSLLSQRIPA